MRSAPASVRALIGLVIVLAVLLVLFALTRGHMDGAVESPGRTGQDVDPSMAPGVEPPMRSDEGRIDATDLSAAPLGKPAAPRGPQNARNFLAAFHGANAGPIIHYLEEKGWNLDTLGPPPLPWEEAKQQLVEQLLPQPDSEPQRRELLLDWPDEPGEEWVQRHFHRDLKLDSARLAELQALARPYLDQAAPLKEEYDRVLKAEVLAKWSRDEFYHAPYTSWRPTNQQGPAVYCKAGGIEGWSFTFTLTPSEAPQLAELSRQLTALASKRDNELLAYLRSL